MVRGFSRTTWTRGRRWTQIHLVWLTAWATLAVGLLIPLAAKAQPLIRIDDHLTCESCSLELRVVSTLDASPSGGSFLGLPPVSLVRTSDSRYLAGPMPGQSAVALFDASGTFQLGYGDRGRGPQEFLGPPVPMLLRLGSGDTLYAFEGGYLHTLDVGSTPPVHLAKVRTDVPAQDAVIVGGSVAVQAFVSGASRRGTTVQVLRKDGSVRNGIDPETPVEGQGLPGWDRYRRIGGVGGREALWSAHLTRFELARFNLAGEEELRVRRDASWFAAYQDLLHGEPFLTPQRPKVEWAFETSDGLLWIGISVGSTTFDPMDVVQGPEFRLDPHLDFSRYLDTIIEVIDLKAGHVLTRRRFEPLLRLVSTSDGARLLYSVRESPPGDLLCDVFEVVLTGEP